MLAVDLRFPNPKPLKREFIELIWKEREEEEVDKSQRRTRGGEKGRKSQATTWLAGLGTLVRQRGRHERDDAQDAHPGGRREATLSRAAQPTQAKIGRGPRDEKRLTD
jgi:hypothetical protein